MPTDTVYGVAAQLENAAVARLYMAKKRAIDKAIPILVASLQDVETVALQPHALEIRLMEEYWPGPLTLVLPKRPHLPENVSQLPTIGVRMPDHDVARTIIGAAGGVLAVTSANLSGQPPALTLDSALHQLGDIVTLGVDGGTAPGQKPSTVARVDASGQVVILREGPISRGQLEQTLKD
jgi:L-threonylcarbamoyladenylate synthase